MVIDTTLFIEHLRATKKKETTLATLPEDAELYVSAVTAYELYIGAKTPEKQSDVDLLLAGLEILPFSFPVAQLAGDIFHNLRTRNQLIEFRDIFIGATALHYNIPVKTLNTKHFERIEGLDLC